MVTIDRTYLDLEMKCVSVNYSKENREKEKENIKFSIFRRKNLKVMAI